MTKEEKAALLADLIGKTCANMTFDECRRAVLECLYTGKSLLDITNLINERVDILTDFFDAFLKTAYLYVEGYI